MKKGKYQVIVLQEYQVEGDGEDSKRRDVQGDQDFQDSSGMDRLVLEGRP